MGIRTLHLLFPGEAGFWLVAGLAFLAVALHPLLQTWPSLQPLQLIWPALSLALQLLLAVLLGRGLALSIRRGSAEGSMARMWRIPTSSWALGLAGLGVGIALGLYRGWGFPQAWPLGLALGLASVLVSAAVRRAVPWRVVGPLVVGGLCAWGLGGVLPGLDAARRFALGAGIYALVMGAGLGIWGWFAQKARGAA